MNACRAERRRGARLAIAAGAALICVGGAVVPVAWAQLGPPTRLTPRIENADEPPAPRAREAEPERPPARPQTGPLDLRPVQMAPVGSPPEAVEPRRGDPAAIEVGQPAALDKDAAGLIDPGRGAFADTLWRGSNRALVERLIGEIPAPIVSTATRSLAIRLLTSGGVPPAGDSLTVTTDTRSFIGRRAEKLMAIGDVADAAALARTVPARNDDETLARVLLDSAWIAYDDSEACAQAFAQIAHFDEPYRQKSLIFCQANGNDKGRAQLGLRMLREQQSEEDALFDRLIALALGETKVPVDSLRLAAPLHLAMARATRQQLPVDTAQGAVPTVLGMIAVSANASNDLRITAAERAEAAGALPTATLAQLYDGAAVRADELPRALDIAGRERGTRARLLPYRAAKAAAPGAARMAILARGWQLARDRGDYAAAARLNLPLLLEVPPDASSAAYCGEAVRALLLTQRAADAHRWFDAATAAAAGDPNIADAAALAWPLLRVAGEAAEISDTEAGARLAAWRAAQQRLDPAHAATKGAMLAVLLSALGDRAAGDLVAQAAAAPGTPRAAASTPSLGVMIGLSEAAAAKRLGETLLFALGALGGDGPASIDPLALSRVLDALRAVGMMAEARTLALEAAIVGGL